MAEPVQRILRVQDIDNWRIFAGDPNGNIYGQPGWVCQDSTNGILYVCSVAGLNNWDAQTSGGVVPDNAGAEGKTLVWHLGSATWSDFLFASDGFKSVDVNGRTLFDSGEVACANWENRTLNDSLGSNVMSWGLQALTDPAGLDSIYWGSRALLDASGSTTVNWDIKELVGGTGNSALRWDIWTLYDTNGSMSAEWNSRILTASDGTAVVDWAANVLYDSGGLASFDWQFRQLMDSAGAVSVDASNRQMLNSTGAVMVDFENGTLEGAAGPYLAWGPGFAGGGLFDGIDLIMAWTTTGVQVTSGKQFRIGNVAVATGALVNTHTLVITDDDGVDYRVLCLA